jgi:transcriptional regulator with XRE-family HTH domain
MSYATEHIAGALRAAREGKGLSQRELSAKSGVPQGHISKIENGAVDLRVSSLVALARVLDLELALVPRRSLTAVKSIVRSSAQGASTDSETARQARKELARLRNAISHLPTELLPKNELEQFRNQARELRHYRLSRSDIETIRNASRAAKALMNNPEMLNAVRHSLSRLRELRNALAHGRGNDSEIESVRPAYSLDEDDHG